MQKLLLVIAVTISVDATVQAQGQKFPYQARVVSEEAYVRSGGGEAFYPTKIIPRGTTVTVRRHDPGGWYQIDPPKGSFSWIPAKYVRQSSANSGEVLESDVVVFVGSSFGDEIHVWQRRMQAGESVEILGERTLDTLSGSKLMLKIAPPNREYRWIPGTAIIPVAAADKTRHDNNAYTVPSKVVEQQIARGKKPVQPVTPKIGYAPSQRLTKLAQIRTEQRRLRDIDQQFRQMIQSDPSKWNLQSIEDAYSNLQKSATHKPVAGQIDLRYPAIERYRLRKSQIDDLDRLTSATEQRDAQLMASQYGLSPGPNIANTGTQENVAFGDMMSVPPLSSPVIAGEALPSIAMTTPPQTQANPPVDSKTSNPYIGAGLLTHSTVDGESSYLLTSPAGKILAHLTADDSVDLENFVGQSVGIHGNRWFDETIKSDHIEVSSLEAVRLRR